MNDERLERIISVLLRAGVLLSAAVVLAGGASFLLSHGNQATSFHVFHAAPSAYRSIHAIVWGAAHFDSLAIIQFGLLLLIATPVARVALSVAAFALERDRTYTVVSLIVLGILLYGLAGAR
ncbi:MAG: DUF1634 domain-containing protein [Bryobacteraceae bacterium]